MAKQYKKFDVTKKYTTKEVVNTETGGVETVPVRHRIGEITVFSDSIIPDDISIRLDMPEHYVMGDNLINVFARKQREA